MNPTPLPAASDARQVPSSFRVTGATRRWLAVVGLGVGLVCGLVGTPVAAAPAPEPSGAYLRDWLLCGPFPVLRPGAADLDAIRLPGMYTDFLASDGGESRVRPQAGRGVIHEGVTSTWVRHSAPADAVNLDLAVSKSNAVVAYAYGEVVSDTPRACILAVGSNDGARVWWNGEEVLDAPGPRGLKLDHNVMPVALLAGTNRVLLKVEERGNSWGFACRLLPLTREFPAERLRLFEVVTKEDGSPVIRTRLSPALAAALVTSARFEAVEGGGAGAEGEDEATSGGRGGGGTSVDRVVWSGTWAGAELPVGVDVRRFGGYRLRLHVELAGGIRQDSMLPFTAGKRVEHVLFEAGRSGYSIVVGTGASESERWAAGELQRWLREVGGEGVVLPVTNETVAGDRALIVGWNDRARGLLGEEAAPASDADESFQYRSVGASVVLWGGRQRGTMYAVMSFLERELGVRFYTPSVTVAPRRTRHAFTGLGHGEKPGVRVRNDFYFEAFDPTWAARNRINGSMGPRPQPGGLESYWSVHTFYPLVPPEEFFREHPEYFSLIDGVRTHERAQLCLSHPDVLRILVDRLRKRMRESPEYLIYDVSQNDWAGPCECRDCQAVVDREGSQSGPVVEFVNQVADAVRAEFPGKYVGTLAYQYTRKPPRTVKPRDNVVVRFCSIECCFAHPFEQCPENRSFVEDMNGWAALAPHIYVWDYVVNFSHYVMPYPNFRVLASNIRFFRDHRAIGIMEQAAYQCRGGEFAELRAYVLARLLWNPEADVEPIVSDFLHGYYGRAGQHVRAYFDLLHGRLTPETHLHLGLQHDDRLFSEAFVERAGRIFDQAEAVADTEDIRRRVELARLPLMYLKCKRTPVLARQDGTYARFVEIAKREGVTHYAEAGEPHRKAFHAEVEAAR